MRDKLPWVSRVWRPVTDVRQLHGGVTSTMPALTAGDGEQAVLRLMTKDPWRRQAPGLLTREAFVQRQLQGSPIPAPRSIAVELTGTPAHLMSWLPGRLRLDSAPVQPIADMLAEIHRFDPGPDRPREFQSWAPRAKRVVPSWSSRPTLWEAAFAVLASPTPAYEGVFLHRDFHLGNLLWDGDRISGVVDWVETSWGPAELDVAHAATYLAMLHGVPAAARLVEAYGRAEVRYWSVMDIVGYLPDPVKVTRSWPGFAVETARRRLEQRLESLLA
ncbi:phosphotransferase family protein [Paractinoplanes lichenicola]|uniref:Aminoglycoside phosphotransferase family protein n=1 Tax=Paractinoplanes lichenicola TaxID=2802976 RepID=A0ABS1VLL1_9ACTN|nr:aminoglycoside phosphotransferase family protein [Actinoplanes lichenicola]MBL7255617.1 aminoglycoside phosphotransferase family protein [Actinoplanes lichenicola]